MLEYTSNIVIYDSWADACHVKKEYNIMITDKKYEDLYHQFDAVILGVAHNEFKNKNIRVFLKDSMKGIVYDVKGVFCLLYTSLVSSRAMCSCSRQLTVFPALAACLFTSANSL